MPASSVCIQAATLATIHKWGSIWRSQASGCLLVLGRLGSLRHSDLIEGNLCGAEMEIASRCGVAREIAPCPGAWRPAFRFCSSAQRTPLTAIATSLAGGEKGG